MSETSELNRAALYERHEGLNIHAPAVAIVGCGGVGVWAALAIALGGSRYMCLYDSDEVSTNNLNRLPFRMEDLGRPKSVVLANLLESMRPDIRIDARANFTPDLHNFDNVGYVVCCTDSLKSRRMVYAEAKRVGIQYLELGADGERWTLSGQPPEFSTELEDAPGYQVVPVHVGPCMMAGAAAAYYVLHMSPLEGDHLGEWEEAKERDEGDERPAWLKMLYYSTAAAGDESEGEYEVYAEAEAEVVAEAAQIATEIPFWTTVPEPDAETNTLYEQYTAIPHPALTLAEIEREYTSLLATNEEPDVIDEREETRHEQAQEE